jgi:hypothetical protein
MDNTDARILRMGEAARRPYPRSWLSRRARSICAKGQSKDGCHGGSLHHSRPLKSALIQSIGTGKMTVEFFSAAISVSVWR